MVRVLGERNIISVGNKINQFTQRTYRFERDDVAEPWGYCCCTMAVSVVTATEFLYFNDSVVLGQNFAGEAGEIFAWVL